MSDSAGAAHCKAVCFTILCANLLALACVSSPPPHGFHRLLLLLLLLLLWVYSTGVRSVQVNVVTKTVCVVHDPSSTTPATLVATLNAARLDATLGSKVPATGGRMVTSQSQI